MRLIHLIFLTSFLILSCSDSSTNPNETEWSSSASASSSSVVAPSSSSVSASSSSVVAPSSSSVSASSSSAVVPSSSSENSIYNESDNTLTDLRDNKVYRTVKIGDQIWMAENLNYYDENNKNLILSCCHENSQDSCSKYGRIYSWSAAMNIDSSYNKKSIVGLNFSDQGVCPDGWHVPSHDDFALLLKNTDAHLTENDNLFGFNAINAPLYFSFGQTTLSRSLEIRFWTSTETSYEYTAAHVLRLAGDEGYYYTEGLVKSYGQAIRCIKD